MKPPAGSRGTGLWSVTTREMCDLKIFGELVFTPKGTALIFCECHQPAHLLLGVAYGHWGTIGAADKK